MQQIVVVDLKEDTIRKFSCIQAIHVAPGYLSAKVINLDAKCKCFGVYFLCLTIFYFDTRIRRMERVSLKLMRQFMKPFMSINGEKREGMQGLCALRWYSPIRHKKGVRKKLCKLYIELYISLKFSALRCVQFARKLYTNYTQTMHGAYPNPSLKGRALLRR